MYRKKQKINNLGQGKAYTLNHKRPHTNLIKQDNFKHLKVPLTLQKSLAYNVKWGHHFVWKLQDIPTQKKAPNTLSMNCIIFSHSNLSHVIMPLMLTPTFMLRTYLFLKNISFLFIHKHRITTPFRNVYIWIFFI